MVQESTKMRKEVRNSGIVFRKPTVKKPGLQPVAPPEIHSLHNGLPLYIFPSDSVSVVRLALVYDAGVINERKPLQALFSGLMLTAGTPAMSAGELEEAFDFFGSIPDFEVERDKATIQIFMLPSSFREAVSLLYNIINDAVFPDSELTLQKATRLQKYLINKKKGSYNALEQLFATLFGTSHPYGRIRATEDFERIGRDDLVQFHDRHYRQGLKKIALSGFVNDQIIRIIEELFGDMTVRSSTGAYPPLPGIRSQSRKTVIELTDTIQNSIRIGRRTVTMDHPDHHGLMVINTILGGYFGSRLMSNLRENKGYTYGIHSSLLSLKMSGIMIISTEVGHEYTRDALKEIYREMDGLRRGKTGYGELKTVKSSMLGELVRQFDGPFLTCDTLMTANDFGLDIDYFIKLEEKIKTIGPGEIKQLAETYYDPEDFYEVIAGRLI